MAGVEGLEPSNDGTKTRCLTNLATPQYLIERW